MGPTAVCDDGHWLSYGSDMCEGIMYYSFAIESEKQAAISKLGCIASEYPPLTYGTGDRVRVIAPNGVSVMSMGGEGGSLLGTQSYGAQGKITLGAGSWWRIDWDSGPDGWTVDYKYKLPTLERASIGAFVIGDRVKVPSNLNSVSVFKEDCPFVGLGGTATCQGGTQVGGAVGTVVGGPSSGMFGYWWKVDWDSGFDGWVTQSGLQKLTSMSVQAPSTALGASQLASALTALEGALKALLDLLK